MNELGALHPGDVKQMALDFWVLIYLLMQAADGGMKYEEVAKRVQARALAFAKKHLRSDNG